MELVRRLFANWPLKLTSVLLALLLWVIATLEEPVTRRVRARIGALLIPVDRLQFLDQRDQSAVQVPGPVREQLGRLVEAFMAHAWRSFSWEPWEGSQPLPRRLGQAKPGLRHANLSSGFAPTRSVTNLCGWHE